MGRSEAYGVPWRSGKREMKILFAQNKEELARCFPIVVQLRTHLDLKTFLDQVQRQFVDDYRIVCIEDQGEVRAVAGFRIKEMLARGRHLYVDDLVTDERARSQGYGSSLLRWLVDYVKAHRCGEVHLDSGVERKDAHRFYIREGMEISAYHFRLRTNSTSSHSLVVRRKSRRESPTGKRP